MRSRSEFNRFLGLPDDAPSETAERRRRELLRWLRSPAVPEEVRSWAQLQAEVVERFYEEVPAPEPGPGAGTEAPPTPHLAASAPQRAGQDRTRGLARLARGPAAFALLGLVVAVPLVLGILQWDRVRGTGAPGTLSAPQAAPALDEARLAQLKAALARNPEDAAALFEIGEAYMQAERWAEAIEWFTRLLNVEPGNLHARIDIGLASMSLGLYSQGEEELLGVLEQDPADVRAHYILGFLYSTAPVPSVDKAREHWEETVRLAPDSDFGKTAAFHIESLGPAPSPP